MKRFIIRTTLVILPVFILLVLVNYFGDAANLFSKNFEMKVAEGLLSGSNVTNVTDYNERLLQKYLITKGKLCPDIVVLGSSRTLELNSSNFPGKTFFNNSVSGATIEDITAIYELYKQNKCAPKNIILGLDPWTLNKNNNQVRWKSLAREYNIFLTELKRDTVQHDESTDKYSQLISPSYFLASFKQLRHSKKPVLIKTVGNKEFTRVKDGSVSYGDDHRNQTLTQIEDKAKEYATVNNIYSVEKFNELSPDVIFVLENFIAALKRDNISVTFFLSPYHPLVYHIFETNDQYKEIRQSEIYYRSLAAKYNIPVLGSFDPQAYGMDGSYFYDGMHCNEQGIKKLLVGYH